MDTRITVVERRRFPRKDAATPISLGRFTLPEATTNELAFNVMPNRPVTESLSIREYRIRPRYIEAIFDRRYSSSMAHSPSHLVFLSALVHTQKMIYTYFCHEFRFEYDPYNSEKLKIWPTEVRTSMPEMIVKEIGISHKLWVRRVRKLTSMRYFVEIFSEIEGVVTIEASSILVLLPEQ
jgi:hypothetical protein